MEQSTNLDEFKEIMKEWLEHDEQIKNLQRQLKEKKATFSKLSEYILTFMNSNDKKVCNVGAVGSLVISTRKSKTISKKDLTLFLTEYMGTPEKATELMNAIDEAKKVKETSFVKLVAN